MGADPWVQIGGALHCLESGEPVGADPWVQIGGAVRAASCLLAPRSCQVVAEGLKPLNV